MSDSTSLWSRFGRWLIYAVPVCVILLGIFGLSIAVHSEITGEAKPLISIFNNWVALKEKEPDIFRARTNGLWAISGFTFAVGIAGFLFVRLIDRYFSNEK